MARLPKVKNKAVDEEIESAVEVADTDIASEETLEVVDTPKEDSQEVQTTEECESVTFTDSDSFGENPETAPPISFDDSEFSKAPVERNVKVALVQNHSCCIGGTHYHFIKGKQYNVPTSVKSILKQAGLLMPL